MQFAVDEVDFKAKYHPFYVYEMEKNEVLGVKLLCPLNREEKQLFEMF